MNKLLAASLTALALVLSACSSGTKATVTPMTITSSSLAGGTVGVAYTQTLAESGGKAPFTWSSTGTTLPGGLTLAASTGILSGMPTTAATTTLGFTVTDSSSPALTATATLGMTVSAAPLVPVVITAITLPGATVGVVYSQTLTATGGTGPYTWSVSTSTLPSGLTLGAATGIFGGTPNTSGTTQFTVTATDSASATGSLALSFTAQPAPVPLAIVTTTLNSDSVGTAFTQTLTASGGTAPYTWSVSSGTLPAGLSLAASTGILSGTPSASGTTQFTVQVTDATTASVTEVLSFTANAVALTGGALLQGQYFFKLDSFADDIGGISGHIFHEVVVGSLILDGAGNVTAGSSDSADDYYDTDADTVTGTYTVNSDGRGALTLVFANAGTRVFAIAAKAAVADPVGSVARNATLVETDAAADYEEYGTDYATGSLQLQDPAAFVNASLVGSSVFGWSGDTFLFNTNPGLTQQGGLSAAGLLVIGSKLNLTSASTLDITTNQVLDTGVLLTGSIAPDTTVVGSSTSFGTYGRALLNLTATGYTDGSLAAQSAVYVIDANTSYIISQPNNPDEPLYSGYLVRQSGTFDQTSLQGSVLAYGTSQGVGALADYSGAGGTQALYGSSDAMISLYTFDGAGNQTTVTTDENLAGSITAMAAGSPTTYTVSAQGRVLTAAANQPIFWLSSPNTGFATSNPAAGAWPMLLTLEPQTPASYTNASFNGSYLTGTEQIQSYKATMDGGILQADGAGNLTGTLDMFNDAGGLQAFGKGPLSVSLQTPYDVSASGRVLVYTFLSEGTKLIGSDAQIFYMVSPTRAIAIDTRAGALAPAIVVLQQ